MNLIQNLKDEYELRYRIVRYKKLYRTYRNQVIEKNNVLLISDALREIQRTIDIKSTNIDLSRMKS